MASGHVNRTYRPNTWLHRPSLRREDFSCQPGAVHTWHETDKPTALRDVRCWVNSGKYMLAWSFSGFGPKPDIRRLAANGPSADAVSGAGDVGSSG
jgi:hypothetical protein